MSRTRPSKRVHTGVGQTLDPRIIGAICLVPRRMVVQRAPWDLSANAEDIPKSRKKGKGKMTREGEGEAVDRRKSTS